MIDDRHAIADNAAIDPADTRQFEELASLLNEALGADVDAATIAAYEGDLSFVAHHPDYVRDNGEDSSDAVSFFLWRDRAGEPGSAPFVISNGTLQTFAGIARLQRANQLISELHEEWRLRFVAPGRRGRLAALAAT